MAVVVMLTALMMPAMKQLHENAQRVACMANLQQMGHAFVMYGGDHNDELPRSEALVDGDGPQDLMMARHTDVHGHETGWDGMGRLFELHYCDSAECFYCPSHHGQHPYERYASQWQQASPTVPVYTNYHYAGHVVWDPKENSVRRRMTDGFDLVLATDGLRTAADFNHILGMNSLRGDGSVHWCDDTDSIFTLLPKTESEQVNPAYFGIWELVEDNGK